MINGDQNMKKFALSVAAVMALTGFASAADLKVKAVKAPPAPVVSPWDIAFGAALMNDYIFRGVTQSNHKASVAAYFEGRYNFNDSLQLYIGTAGESISFPNRAAAEIDVYGGIRPTFGAFAFDFGVWGYLYPGGTCFNAAAFPGSGIPGSGADCVNNAALNGGLPINGNVIKRDVSFVEGYGKVVWTINDMFALGANEYYSPNFLNSGAWGNYASGTAKFTAPSTWFGSSGVGMYISGEFGRQWLGTSDRFYGVGPTALVPAVPASYAFGIPYRSYNTWNAGLGFTWKVFTLDARYSDTNLSKADCNAFTSDWATTNGPSAANANLINPGGFGSNWCGAAGIVKLSVDTTLNALK
jgi:Bacterial protein of unknown function (Gcw_chp)